MDFRDLMKEKEPELTLSVMGVLRLYSNDMFLLEEYYKRKGKLIGDDNPEYVYEKFIIQKRFRHNLCLAIPYVNSDIMFKWIERAEQEFYKDGKWEYTPFQLTKFVIDDDNFRKALDWYQESLTVIDELNNSYK